jgi:hypothetical protein
MLPVVDKPAIQYVVEEAVRRRDRRHPHHHRPRTSGDRGPLRPVNFELEYYLEAGGKHDELAEVRAPGRAGRHPLRAPGRAARPRPRRVGGPQARGRQPLRRAARRRHHGPHSRGCSRDMIAATEQYGRSVLALMRGAAEEISLYGCAVEPERWDDQLVRVTDMSRSPRREAPSNLAVMGATCSPPRSSSTRAVEPGVVARSSSPTPSRCCSQPGVNGWCSTAAATTSATSSTTCGPCVELASSATTSAPSSATTWPSSWSAGLSPDHLAVIPLAEARARVAARLPTLARGRGAPRRGLGLRHCRGGDRHRAGAAVRQHGDGRLRRARRRHRRRERTPRCACDVVGTVAAGRAPTWPVGPGRGGADHDRRADARRAPTPW